MDHIESCLNALQFVSGIGQIIPHIPGNLCHILHLIHHIRHFFMEGRNILAVFCDSCKRPFRNGKKRRRAVGILAAIEILHGIVQPVGNFLRILQQLAAGFQFLVLSRLQLRLFDFFNLVFECLHPAQLFALVHAHAVNFPAQLGNSRILLRIGSTQVFVAGKIIQKL